MKILVSILLVFIALGFNSPIFALEGESIVLDPATGNYQITYHDSDDSKYHQIIFVPSTKIDPKFKIKFKLGGLQVNYDYRLINGHESRQDIVNFIIDPVSSVTTPLPDIPLDTPPQGTLDTSIIEKVTIDMLNVAKYFDTSPPWKAIMTYSEGQKAFRIGWRTKVSHGMHPGESANFGLNSRDLPGIIQSEIYGYAPDSQEIPGEETQNANDGGFGQQYTELISHNFVSRPAAVPTIPVPDPFDAAALLGNIQTQMHTWIDKQLLDATFSSQLDRYFQSAISACQLNQPKACKQQIDTMRAMVRKEQPDTGRDEDRESDKSRGKDDGRKTASIDQLAANVLDFDLDYVTKRMEEGDREHASSSEHDRAKH